VSPYYHFPNKTICFNHRHMKTHTILIPVHLHVHVVWVGEIIFKENQSVLTPNLKIGLCQVFCTDINFLQGPKNDTKPMIYKQDCQQTLYYRLKDSELLYSNEEYISSLRYFSYTCSFLYDKRMKKSCIVTWEARIF
jgi:hypothetical protein